MQQVVHDFLREEPLGVEEPLVEVEPDDVLAVGEALDDGVHLFVALAGLVVRSRPAREDRQQEHLRLGMLLADHVDDAPDALCDVLGVLVLVVRADHHLEELGLVSLKLAVLHPPEEVARLVAAVAEVEDAIRLLQLGEELASLAALALPAVRDGVADHHDVVLDVSVVDDLVALLEGTALPPPHEPGKSALRNRGGRRAVEVAAGGRRPCRGDDFVLAGRQHLVDQRDDGARPDLVAARVRVEQVGEQLSAEAAIPVEELVGEVAPDDLLTVGELRYLLVHDVVADAVAVARQLAAREYRRKNDPRLRLLFGDDLQYPLYAEYRVDRRLLLKREVACVVGADHEQYALSLVSVELAALSDAPKDMLRAVCAGAEVEGLVPALREVLLPLFLAGSLPAMRNRIANEHDLLAAVRDDAHLLGVALHLPAPRIAVPRRGRDGPDGRGGNEGGGNRRDRHDALYSLHAAYYTLCHRQGQPRLYQFFHFPY